MAFSCDKSGDMDVLKRFVNQGSSSPTEMHWRQAHSALETGLSDHRTSDKPVSRALCSCRQCISVEDEDPWFMKRFNTSISPLLSQENAILSKSTYYWWQRLQTKQNANYGDVVRKLFKVVPGEGHYNDSAPNRCRTCAVVGNSGNLNGSDYGALIDSNDFIIRMNKAPILGYEKDVGNRTTHRVMYPESATNLQKDTSLLLIPFKTLDLEWITSALTTGTVKCTRMPVMAKINADKNKVLIYNPTFLKYVYDVWLELHGKYPSTGFLTLMFAIHVCDEVNVFGFGAAKDGTWQHYWEKNKFTKWKPTGLHAGDYELQLTILLTDKEIKTKITFYWTPAAKGTERHIATASIPP
ncbi:CMP-N-acetylneuraminate-beta-galactosamide-alpha-2,3-sialyltransferase 1-like [Conger conger]|uniref:CMP-N-acetylneuraminate-beta-galactosamide- alpha-2,3-sialyltransferase 1-like n=1 Tax=Conger conger TaxID=82655 RepID=UPI002A59D6C9|nr:CMP-N-acetylneuraminate-beta-galactosamide-alpha-2,3-sialyltransferase 1-like [Conger conger]